MAGSLLGAMDVSLLTQIGIFFAKAGAFVFGSGLAIVPFLCGGARGTRPVSAAASMTGRRSNEVLAIDAASLKIIARMPTGRCPDGLAYASNVHELYVPDESGRIETVTDNALPANRFP